MVEEVLEEPPVGFRCDPLARACCTALASTTGLRFVDLSPFVVRYATRS